MNYLIIGITGIIGGAARYYLGELIKKKSNGKMLLLHTFLINIAGALLLGIFTALTRNVSTYTYLVQGLLGGYTTVSIFMYNGINLLKNKKNLNSMIYMMLTIILSVIFYDIAYISLSSF